MLVHAVQMIGVGTSTVAFRLVLGPYVFLYGIGTTFGVEAGFAPQLQFYIAGSPSPPHIVINVLALVCFVLLIRWTYLTELVPESVAVPTKPDAPRDPQPAQGFPPIHWP